VAGRWMTRRSSIRRCFFKGIDTGSPVRHNDGDQDPDDSITTVRSPRRRAI
jgi:hypothetical protein